MGFSFVSQGEGLAMQHSDVAAIILAAGEGVRMKSKKPKVAHEVLGKPLVRWVVDAAKAAGVGRIITVVGHGKEQVAPLVEDTTVVEQVQQRGTADAVCSCAEALAGFTGALLVLSGDCPLIEPETIEALIDARHEISAAASLLTMEPADPTGYGRIVREDSARAGVLRIVEQKDATPEEAAIAECNAGFYCFDAPLLFEALGRVDANNAQGEFYLTDVVRLFVEDGRAVVAVKAQDARECSGVNSRIQLAEITAFARDRINRAHMEAGVSMMDPLTTWIGPDVRLSADVELLPEVMLFGSTSVGEGSVVGPFSRLVDTQVGCGCTIDETVAIEAQVDDGATCGPRAYLRPGAHLCKRAKAGTHVEIKKSTIGEGSKVPHLSYIGDCTMGAGVNIGAGTITCNYDGTHKFPTIIGDEVFVGSDTMLVAPVTVGDRALIGAGSCITQDVDAGALALGRARQTQIDGWADKHHQHDAGAVS